MKISNDYRLNVYWKSLCYDSHVNLFQQFHIFIGLVERVATWVVLRLLPSTEMHPIQWILT